MSEAAVCSECSTPLPPSGDCQQCPTQVVIPVREAGDLHISGYEVLGRLGEGGMGAVYLAEEKCRQ